MVANRKHLLRTYESLKRETGKTGKQGVHLSSGEKSATARRSLTKDASRTPMGAEGVRGDDEKTVGETSSRRIRRIIQAETDIQD